MFEWWYCWKLETMIWSESKDGPYIWTLASGASAEKSSVQCAILRYYTWLEKNLFITLATSTLPTMHLFFPPQPRWSRQNQKYSPSFKSLISIWPQRKILHTKKILVSYLHTKWPLIWKFFTGQFQKKTKRGWGYGVSRGIEEIEKWIFRQRLILG